MASPLLLLPLRPLPSPLLMRVNRWFPGASRGRKDHESFRVRAREQAPRGGAVQVGRGEDAGRDDVTHADGKGARQWSGILAFAGYYCAMLRRYNWSDFCRTSVFHERA